MQPAAVARGASPDVLKINMDMSNLAGGAFSLGLLRCPDPETPEASLPNSWIVAVKALQAVDDAQREVCPRFWDACVTYARMSLGEALAAPPQMQWFTGDLGRRTLLIASAAFAADLHRLSLARLLTFADAQRICSPGRVRNFFDNAVRLDAFRMRPHPQALTRRVIQISDEMLSLVLSTLRPAFSALQELRIVDADVFEWLSQRPAFAQFCGSLPIAATFLRTPLAPPSSPLVQLLEAEGAQRVLDVLMIGDEGRPGVRRSQIAARARVSRAQTHRIVSGALARGHLILEGEHLLMSEDLRRDVAFRYGLAFSLLLVTLHLSDAPVGGYP